MAAPHLDESAASPEMCVRARIAETGPVPFAEVVELALYHPAGGFYADGGRAGRRGDFLTSPEVGPLFGSVLASAIDEWWVDAGRPDPFEVVDVGTGPGTLARSVLAASPACAAALRYVLVERSATQRALHGELGGARSVETPPTELGVRFVIANELLDNLPFGLLERTVSGWAEVRVDCVDDRLVEVLVEGAAGPPIEAEIGARVPTQAAATAWVRDARRLAGPGGCVLAVDYASTTPEMAARPWQEWVRTYRRHERGGPPLEALGSQDITCEVAVDQLPPPTVNRSQAEWLRAHGVEALVADARAAWHERAAIGDLAAVRSRSRVTEAAALLDPAGLGAFRVLEWTSPVL